MSWITILVGIAAVVGFFYLVGLLSSKTEQKNKAATNATAKRKSNIYSSIAKREALGYIQLDMKDFDARVYSVKWRYPNIHEFSAFDTPAAILWAKGGDEVCVVVNKNIVSGVAKSANFDTYSYDIKNDMWLGPAPRGTAVLCKAEIKTLLQPTPPSPLV
jgi:hypothetical protein